MEGDNGKVDHSESGRDQANAGPGASAEGGPVARVLGGSTQGPLAGVRRGDGRARPDRVPPPRRLSAGAPAGGEGDLLEVPGADRGRGERLSTAARRQAGARHGPAPE